MDNTSQHKHNKSNDENVVKMSENNEKSNEFQPMAESSQSSTNWWTSLVQKSSHTFESIKKDLNELKETVQTVDTLGVVSNTVSNTASYVSQTMRDTITGISQTMDSMAGDYEDNSSDTPVDRQPMTTQTDVTNDSNERSDEFSDKCEDKTNDDNESDDWAVKLTNRAKDKLNSLVGSIADAFLMNRNYYEDEDQMYVLSGDQLVAIDRWQQLLSEVQTDPNTYIKEPIGAPEHYESWLMTFNLIDYRRQTEQMLQTVPQMKQFYTQLVPNSLSDVEFWHRYYYRVHHLRETERKKIVDKSEDKSIVSKELTEDSNRSKNSVEIKLLDESNQIKQQLIGLEDNESDIRSTPDISDAQKSETESPGSDDWEKTDLVVSDEDKDWVKCE